MDTNKAKCYRLVQVIGLRLHPHCQVPECKHRSVTMHHLFPRNRMATAFYLDALFAVCLTHHALAHAEPIEFEAIAIKCLKDQYYELQALSRTIVRFREADYKRIAEALEGLAVLTN
jgi:hypothetical protein